MPTCLHLVGGRSGEQGARSEAGKQSSSGPSSAPVPGAGCQGKVTSHQRTWVGPLTAQAGWVPAAQSCPYNHIDTWKLAVTLAPGAAALGSTAFPRAAKAETQTPVRTRPG